MRQVRTQAMQIPLMSDREASQSLLSSIYQRAHNTMRNIDGLQPQEAFDELLKYLFLKQVSEDLGAKISNRPNEIRAEFSKCFVNYNSWSTSLWRDRQFYLSDDCLMQCSLLFEDIRFSNFDCDIRSAALREFLTPNVRKGLGIYLTPDEVVREVVRIVDPPSTALCLDPACGSGTFLIELIKHWRGNSALQCKVWGADKNPRMLLIAELNLGHFSNTTFSRRLMDSLSEPGPNHALDWCRPEYFDYVFTNPPFGVVVDFNAVKHAEFCTAYDSSGAARPRQASEWLFAERCLRWLKPGGTLAIVLPRSVLSNPSAAYERSRISSLGALKTVILLPPETFYLTGTQTNAVVAIIEKYDGVSDHTYRNRVKIATVSNVGFDTTGRLRPGSQLQGLSDHLRKDAPAVDYISVVPNVLARESLNILSPSKQSLHPTKVGLRLGDLTESIANGRTPPRSAYSTGSDGGLFLVKVGNLSGAGISWLPRERNFIDTASTRGRKFNTSPLVQIGDLLLTSSAHSPVYIGKKVDIVTSVPKWVGGKASFVGEVMLIRLKVGRVDPYALLAFLRHPKTNEQIRSMVRGQTAHLYPADISDLQVPHDVIEGTGKWGSLIKLLKIEVHLNDELNEVAYNQRLILGSDSD